MSYRCTECDAVHDSFDAAAACHYGIGGVEEVESPADAAAIALVAAVYTVLDLRRAGHDLSVADIVDLAINTYEPPAEPEPAPEPVVRPLLVEDGVTKFEVGRTYSTRSLGDWDCIYTWTVVARTAKFVTTQYMADPPKRTGIYVYDGIERTRPFGDYSMAPSIGADRPDDLMLATEGGIG